MQAKTCTKCGIEKELSEFHKDKSTRDGHVYFCKKCIKNCSKKQVVNLKKQRKQRNNIFLQKGIKMCSYCNKEKKISEFHKDNRKNDGYRIYCKTCAKKFRKEYYKNNKEKELKLNKEYCKIRKKIDINFKIKCNLRIKLWKHIVSKNIKKINQTLKLTGCTIEELKIHLEQQFQKGMTWENHGLYGWHIDHIIPCSSFDLTDPEQQKQCFHYTNLQPLWAEDNLSKNNKPYKEWLKEQKNKKG